MATMYRCILFMSGDECGFANAMMNELLDGKPATVMAELKDLDRMGFTNRTAEDSFIPEEFELYEAGDYRLGWDTDPQGEDEFILEKVYQVSSAHKLVDLRDIMSMEFPATPPRQSSSAQPNRKV